MTAHNWFWNNAERKKPRPWGLCSPSRLLTVSPGLIWAPRLFTELGATVLVVWAYCVPHLHGWELKSPFCFLQTLSVFFLCFFFFFKFGLGGREGQDFGHKDSNHQEGASPSPSPPVSISTCTEVFFLLINTWVVSLLSVSLWEFSFSAKP